MTKKVPMRKCVGCNTSKQKNELLRIYYYQDVLGIDEENNQNGRGVYICKDNPNCLSKANKKKAIFRCFPTVKTEQVEKLFHDLGERINE